MDNRGYFVIGLTIVLMFLLCELPPYPSPRRFKKLLKYLVAAKYSWIPPVMLDLLNIKTQNSKLRSQK